MNDKPFKPSRIRLVNGTIYDIHDPWMIMIGDSSAVVVTQVRKDDFGYETALDWRTISIADIVEFSDLETKKRDRKKA
jgi:hypothetical protein